MVAAPGGGKGTQGERLAAKFGIDCYRDRDILVEVNGDQSPDSITADIQARLPR